MHYPVNYWPGMRSEVDGKQQTAPPHVQYCCTPKSVHKSASRQHPGAANVCLTICGSPPTESSVLCHFSHDQVYVAAESTERPGGCVCVCVLLGPESRSALAPASAHTAWCGSVPGPPGPRTGTGPDRSFQTVRRELHATRAFGKTDRYGQRLLGQSHLVRGWQRW